MRALQSATTTAIPSPSQSLPLPDSHTNPHRAGTNDLGSLQSSSPAAISSNVCQLHALAREGGVRRTLAVGIPESRFASGGRPFDEKRRATNALIEANAKEVSDSSELGETMVYIDCPVLFGNETGHWESDGLHMAKLGYQELGRRLAAPVAALVEAEVNGRGAMKGGGAAAAAVEASAGAAEADAEADAETSTEAPTEPNADAADAAAAAAADDAHVPVECTAPAASLAQRAWCCTG